VIGKTYLAGAESEDWVAETRRGGASCCFVRNGWGREESKKKRNYLINLLLNKPEQLMTLVKNTSSTVNALRISTHRLPH